MKLGFCTGLLLASSICCGCTRSSPPTDVAARSGPSAADVARYEELIDLRDEWTRNVEKLESAARVHKMASKVMIDEKKSNGDLQGALDYQIEQGKEQVKFAESIANAKSLLKNYESEIAKLEFRVKK